ncbi:6981_t:CDS:1, partial [Cetraspora pellucida]
NSKDGNSEDGNGKDGNSEDNNSKNKNSSNKPFLLADKFMHMNQNIPHNSNNAVTYLCHFDQGCKDFYKKSLTILEQKVIYEKLHNAYKKALHKALQTNYNSKQLIILLKDFIEEDSNYESDSDESL